MVFDKIIICSLSILACTCFSCRKFQLPPCGQFETVCSISLDKADGVFKLGEPITIKGVIPYSATDRAGKAISIESFEPWSLWIGFARIEQHTDHPTNVRDKLNLKILKGKLLHPSTWTDSLKTPQFVFARTDTSFMVEFQINPPSIGVYSLLTKGGSFHKTSCAASYNYSMNLESNNYSFYEEIRGAPWPVHPIKELNPFFFKVIR